MKETLKSLLQEIDKCYLLGGQDLLKKERLENIESKIRTEVDVTHPQRHFFGNKEECKVFVRLKDKALSFNLKDILQDFNENGFLTPDRYEHAYDDKLNTSF